jgi:hypothetical protein
LRARYQIAVPTFEADDVRMYATASIGDFLFVVMMLSIVLSE